MVRYLLYSFVVVHQLLSGQSYMTQPFIQTQMRSNQNGSSTQTEACVMIQF